MQARVNRRWLVEKRPRGAVSQDDFRWHEAPIEEPGPGEALVRNLYLSCDPTQLGWMSTDTYLPAVPLGEVMRSLAVGEVIASRHPALVPGQLVQGLFGWQEYAIVRDSGPYPVLPVRSLTPLEHALGVLGNHGLAAYFGLLDVARARAGETLVVSAAAGATGSLVAQLGKLHGCRVIGIAGGEDKCRYLVDELGLDAAIDYKNDNVLRRLRESCPDGVDVYFDNVGGKLLDAVLLQLRERARVVICGAIATYASTTPTPLINHARILRQRARVEGFNVLDFVSRAGEALEALAAWCAEGRLTARLDVEHGLEHAPRALAKLFTGENRGKQVVALT